MSKSALSRPAARLSAFYAAMFLVAGIQLPFWPVWLSARGLTAKEIGFVLAAAIWAKVIATPAIGALSDRLGRRRAVMGTLAAVALAAYAALWPAAGFWTLIALNLVALTAQSALMPLGDTVTLTAVRSDGLDYGRIRVWGSVTFILASLGSGAVLASTSANRVLALVLGASALVLASCLAIPALNRRSADVSRFAPWRAIARNPIFWMFAATAAVLQASHQVYYGFGSLHWRSLGFSETVVGCLWAEGVLAEILLFWQGGRLLARFGPVGLMALGAVAGILRWSLAAGLTSLAPVAALQLLHAFTFGASHLGAMHLLSRTVPPFAAASAQTIYAAVTSGLGSGVVMLAAGALYADHGGRAYFFMAVLSAVGFAGSICLRRATRGPKGAAGDPNASAS